jgi:Rrf2 family protein
MSASHVSNDTKLPEPTVQKVLKLMASKKIITAQRGAGGGYLLPLSLSCISVYDLVEAIEGPIEMAPCENDTDQTCELARLFAPKKRWNKVNLAIKHTLDKIRISELVTSATIAQE